VGKDNMSKCSNYHHGDLRNALIMAAVDLIEDSGSEEFAMSDAAKRAGVSAAAPYRHFKDKGALLEAVCDLYFIGLAEETSATRDAYPEGARECIIAMGQLYARYVLSRQAFYNLAWSREMDAQSTPQDQAERPGFHVFIGVVEAWCKKQGLADTDPLDLGIKLWALVHGLAVLEMNGQLKHYMPRAKVPDMLTSSANAFLDGLEQNP
jgi:AcrR family transcriptional regulator